MSKDYEKKIVHHIYAIIEPGVDVVYVGKTTIENPLKKRNNAINGRIRSVDGEFSEKCKFFLLESIYVSKPVAFRHILAWYRFFEENGYDVLAMNGAAYMLEFPQDETMNIYNEVCLAHSVEEVLERKILPLKRIEEPEQTQTEPYPFTQLNIRVRENVADSFRSISRKLGLSQNDTLKLLLMEKDDEIKISLADEICALKQEIHNYKELVEQQRKQHSIDKNRAIEKNRQLVKIFRDFINLLADFLKGLDFSTGETIKPKRFNDCKELFHSCSYPLTSGCCIATMDEIIMGKYHTSELGKVTPTKFLLFSTLDGKKMKLRLYGGNSFVGFYPMAHAYKNSLWIVGYTISDDGAANMVLGIPLDCVHKESPVNENTFFEEKEYSLLDDLISGADDVIGHIL